MTLATLAIISGFFAWLLVDHLSGLHGTDRGIDLLVYRAGGHALLTGHSIYAPDFAAINHSPHGLAFTYPPFSAVFFIPLALLSEGTAQVVMVVLNTAAAVTLFVVIAVATQGKWDRLRSWRSLTAPISLKTAIAAVTAAALFTLSVPVQHNMLYGQVNLLLAAGVALDLLTPAPVWPRGLLVGIAVAIKLTPAVFIGYFLVTRQWRALAASLAGTALATAVGWLVLPSDTARYLTSTVFQPARIGGLTYASNQSVRGIVERIPALDGVRALLCVVATAVVLVLAVIAIEHSRRSADPVAGVLAAGFIGLLCSPVSWGHHWVWLSAAAVYFLVRWAAVGGVGNLAAGLVVATVIRAAPWTHLPKFAERERLWTPFEHVLGSVWALTALSLLVWFAARCRDSGRPTSPEQKRAAASVQSARGADEGEQVKRVQHGTDDDCQDAHQDAGHRGAVVVGLAAPHPSTPGDADSDRARAEDDTTE